MVVKCVCGGKGYTTRERTAIRPAVDVCGIWGGYTGEGAKTVLPSKAYAKLSCRLVPHQQHHKIEQMMIDHFNRTAPDTVQVKIEAIHGGELYVCAIDLPDYKATEQVYEEAFGKLPLDARRVGLLPIISHLDTFLAIH